MPNQSNMPEKEIDKVFLSMDVKHVPIQRTFVFEQSVTYGTFKHMFAFVVKVDVIPKYVF